MRPDPHVGEEHQAGVVEDRAVAFFHGVQLRRQVGVLLDMETRDALVSIGIVVVRGGMVALFYIEEAIIRERYVNAILSDSAG